jgi:methylated-DNA-[protein]-cysteine S-methyltransferase
MPHGALLTPVGPLTVYATADALIALDWRDSGCGMVTPLIRDALDQLEAYFDGTLRRFSLPLSPPGTDFQKRVWSVLATIPYGETLSYGAVAALVSSGPRAVANACARNPLPIIIPCHRVVGAGGALTGYSGGDGITTKAVLLDLEKPSG